MRDVVIRRCTVRLVRRRGWSWGPDPARLVRRATARIGELLETKVSELWPDDGDLEIAAPVRIRFPARLSELLDERHDCFNESGLTPIDSRLDERIEKIIDEALAPFVALHSAARAPSSKDEEHSKSPEAIASRRDVEPTGPEARMQGRIALQRLLVSWREQAILARTLASLSPQALEALHYGLLARAGDSRRGESPTGAKKYTPETIAEFVRTIAEQASGSAFPIQGELTNRSDVLRLRLYVATEAAAHFKIELHHSALLDTLDRELPLFGSEVEVRDAFDRTRALTAPPLVAAATRRLWQGDFAVSSALPFLLLGPLSRIGYIDALASALEVAGLSRAASSFAQGLAYKVLAVPERGWRRRPADVATAMVFAGQADPISGSDLADFARQISPYLSFLDSVLRESLIDGHTPGTPLLILAPGTASEAGLLLVDVEGIFPVAWAADLNGLMPTLMRFGEDPLLIPVATTAVVPLDRLHAAGLRFITDAPPLRNERWRPPRQAPALRFWTNDETTLDHKLMALTSNLAATEEEAAVLWRFLMVQRPSVPPGPDNTLDRSLSMAAAAALGTIAWMLWRNRESVAPYLAIDRFHDLNARVIVDQDAVHVRLPLGKRSQDLFEHGFLSDVRDIPWLGGRLLEFSRG